MANRKRDAGREALEKKGWWRSHRWLVLRRLCQFFVLGMFLSGPWFGVWILHGNYSSSLLFDTVPLTDPLMTLQSLASGHLPATVALTGAVIITVLYALAGKRLFCSWVCPLNPITDLANWLRRRFDLNQSATIPRHIRYVLLVVILVGSALTGTLIWEWINPVSLMGRSLVMGFGSGALLIEREKLAPAASLTGVDIAHRAIDIARKNAENAGSKAKFICNDMLRFEAKRPYDEIVANLPFGNRVGTHANNERLYAGLLDRLPQWLNEDGVAILYTMEFTLLKKLIRERPKLKLVTETRTEAGGLMPGIFIIKLK